MSDYTDDVNGERIASERSNEAVVMDVLMTAMEAGANHMVRRLNDERGIGVTYFQLLAASLAYAYDVAARTMEKQAFEDFEIARLHILKLVSVIPQEIGKLTPSEGQLADVKGLKVQ